MILKKAFKFTLYLLLLLVSTKLYSIERIPIPRQVYITNGDHPDFAKNGYPHENWQKITVPSTWQSLYPRYNGICWYRIPFFVTAEQAEQPLGISLGVISDSDETYLNGVLIGKTGNISKNKAQAYDITRYYRFPHDLVIPDRTNMLAVRVKGYFKTEAGIVNGRLFIDSSEEILMERFKTSYLRTAFLVVFLVVGAYFLLFFFRVPEEISYLYFGLFTLIFATYFFMKIDLTNSLPFDFVLLKKLEYLFLFLLIPLFTIFIRNFLKLRISKFLFIYYMSALAGIVFVAITPEPLYWDWINTSFVQFTWFAGLGYVYLKLIQASRRQPEPRLLLVAVCVMTFALIYDILLLRNLITSSWLTRLGLLSPVTSLLFVSAVAYILSSHFVRLHRENKIKTMNLTQTLIERDQALRKVDATYIETINRFSVMAEMRDPETGGHIKRVSHYVRLLAEKMGLKPDLVEMLYLAAPMHDVGKVGIPDTILFKNGPLTADEWTIMKKHTTIGARFFDEAESPVLKQARQIAIAHHEKWDGSGYPWGLKQTEIPLSGRIMALADVYDALRSKRPYKKSFTHEEALAIIRDGDGRVMPTHFDPDVLKAFLDNESLFAAVFETHEDDDDDLKNQISGILNTQ